MSQVKPSIVAAINQLERDAATVEPSSTAELIFRSPPFTPEVVSAIKLIAPQYDFHLDEISRSEWEQDQNLSCWREYEALRPLFNRLPRPNRILEIGPGVGRSAIFFAHKCGWHSEGIHLYEGDGTSTKYTLLGPRFRSSFCGNIAILKATLEYNGVLGATIFDAKQWKLSDLPAPYDFLYSFYAIGFHWSLEYFLDDVLSLMHQKTVAVFTVPPSFGSFSQLNRLEHSIIEYEAVSPKGTTLKLLLLSKSPLP